MSRKYKFVDQSQLYFISTAIINWIDVFTRNTYKDILIDSLKYCQQHKDLDIYAYCIMTNHLHMIIGTRGRKMEDTLRDMKQYTARRILEEIKDNPTESRKDWMLWMFERAGKKNPGNEIYQFWQHDNHPIELTHTGMFKQKLDYIHDNPVTAGFVDKPEDWLYSSAKNYYTNELTKLEVMVIG
jgi:putative transposase